MSIYRWLASFVLVLVFLVPTLIVIILGTESGSRWVLSKAISFAPVDIHYEEFNGSLLDEFSFKHITVETGSFSYAPDVLDISWQPLNLLSGVVDMRTIQSKGGTVRLRRTENTENDKPTALSLKDIKLQLPLKLNINSLNISNTRFFIFEFPSQELNINASALLSGNGHLNLRRIRLNHQYLTTSLSGKADLSYPFQSQFKNVTTLHSPDYPHLTIDSELSGSTDKINFVSKFNEGLSAQIEGHINEPLNQLSWSFNSQWNKNTITPWLESFNVNDIKGAFEGALKGSGDLQHALLSPNLRVEVNQRQADVNGQLSYHEMAVKLKELTVSSATEVIGDIIINGDITKLDTAPQVDILAQWDKLSYKQNSITSADGRLELNGLLNELTINLEHQVAGILPDNFTLTSKAQLSQDTLDISTIKLAQNNNVITGRATLDWQDALNLRATLSGNYMGHALTGNVQLRQISPYLFVEKLQGSWGEQSIDISGALSPGRSLNWSISLNDLSTVSDLNGKLSANGSVEGSLNQPEFSITFKHFSFKSPNYKEVYLTKAVEGSLNSKNKTFSFTPICLSYKGVESPLCMNARQQGDLVKLDSKAEAIPLELIQALTIPSAEYELNGQLALDIGADFNLATAQIERIDAFISADDSQLKLGDESASLNKLNLKAKSNGNEVTVNINAQSNEHEFTVKGIIHTLDFSLDSDISGKFELSSDNLELINLLSPQTDIGKGNAYAKIDIAGTVKEPTASGKLNLQAEKVVLLRTGTLVENLDAELQADANVGEFEVTASADLGEGKLTINGQVNALKRVGNLTINGSHLLLADTPDILIEASPNVTVELNKNLISVTGNLRVPRARITPVEFNQAVTESADVRLKNEERAKSLFKTETDLTVSLGDDVQVEALGFAGKLQGSLRVNQQPDSPAKGNGVIGVVSGEYEIYGQKLTIERGDLLFNGGPISNPSLNLRVTRKIQNTASSQRPPEQIGARVTGSIDQPELNLFSTPPLPDSTILSYLLFGKPPGSQGDVNNLELQAALLVGGRSTEFLTDSLKETFNLDEVSLDSETSDVNDTSLYIGKHLSPDLYIKYGIGLIEPTSTFILRYSLSERLIFESTSTSEGQGGDLIYSIEK